MSTTPTLSKADQFMQSPLVAWLKTFDNAMPMETVHDLSNGVLMNKVMYTVDPNAYSMSKVNRSVQMDIALSLQNLQLLIQRIKHFYLTSVQQLVISNLPNISSICYDPEGDYSLDQLEKIIILLLGCAIQCESKGPIIEKMKGMGLSQQQALVMYIQQVTESTDFVCSIDWNDLEEISKQNLEGLCRTAYIHLQRVAKERDNQYDHMVEILLERDYFKSLHESQNPNASVPRENGLPSLLSSPLKSPSINPEMLELKKKCRSLQEKLDNKLEILSDLREELDRSRVTISKLTQEKRDLSEDAKNVRVYRDEVETLRIQSGKVEKLEIELVKYRQKAEDTDYLKKRISELQGQNDLMLQTKKLLEQKAISLSAKTDTIDDLQEELASLKVRTESLQEEKEIDNEKIEELLALHSRQEMNIKHYEEKLSVVTSELESLREASLNSASGEASNLSFELTEADLASKAKVLRLEKETREMEKTVESLRHAQAKVGELEKTNKKLYSQAHSDRKDIIKLKEENEVLKVKASRVDKLQVELNSQREQLAESSRLAPKLKNIKGRNEALLETKAKLEDQVESLQSKLSLLDDLRDENVSLKVQLDSHSSEQNENEKRIQEVMESNAQLELEKQKKTEEMESLRAQLLQLQTRTGSSSHVTVLSPPRVSEAEIASRAKLQRLEKETREMEKSIEALRHSQAKCSELEKINKKLQEQTHSGRKEIIKLKEELHGNMAKLSRVEQLQSEIKSQEHQLEDIDGARKKITELKQQNALLSETKVLLEEELTGLHNKLDKLADLQADNAALKVRVESLEGESEEEGLRMQELLQQNAQLEMIKDSKSVEIEALLSKLSKLKPKASDDTDSPSTTQASSPEESLATQTKVLRLERDNRELERSVQVLKQSSERVNAEIEKTNKKLTAQIHADKKEIARLKEEMRRERNHHARMSRISSVGDESDMQETKQLQDLETKFKDFYSQSLSNKDDRIKVLDSRVEEMMEENDLLKHEIKDLRKHLDKLKDVSNGGSPRVSPGMSRTCSPREMNRLREQASDSIRLRDKVHTLKQDNTHLSSDLLEAKHVISHQESHAQRLNDRIQMLEQLNHTLDEEKRTLLVQINKLLEKNQEILVKTLENRDHAYEEEKMFTDRLGELERDKARLTEQLISQQREQISKEMDLWKKSKSKNILKKGFKKLKGKIQGRSHTFEVPEGSGLGGSSNTLSGGSMGSPGGSGLLGAPPYHVDGSVSHSSQSISSSNSGRHSEDQDIIDIEGSLVPRAATMDNSPFLRQKKGRSYTLPGGVKLRHGHVSASLNIGSDRPTDNLISLEDFLAESEKTPNKRRVMELKRASLIINTPPSTPRNSLYLPAPSSASNSSQMFDLQEFLSKFDPSDPPGVIPEDEEVQELSVFPSREFKSSQQSMSQRSRSSTSLQSAPSQTSISRENVEGNSVVINPATSANFNNNNSNNTMASNTQGSGVTNGLSFDSTYSGRALVEGHTVPSSSTPNSEHNQTIFWDDTSRISSQSHTNAGPHGAFNDPRRVTFNDGFLSSNHRSKSFSAVSKVSKSQSSDSLKNKVKKEKGHVFFKKHSHKSTVVTDLPESKSDYSNSHKPPSGKSKTEKASSGKSMWVNTKGSTHPDSKHIEASISDRYSCLPNLAALTELGPSREQTDYLSSDSSKRTDKSTRLSLPIISVSNSYSSDNVYLATTKGRGFFSTGEETPFLSQPSADLDLNPPIPAEESLRLEYGSL